MPYPWPFKHVDPVLQFALDIAMDYLEFTEQAYPFSLTEVVCARVILDEWIVGGRRERHPLWLANRAIVSVETRQPMLGPVPIRAAGPRSSTTPKG